MNRKVRKPMPEGAAILVAKDIIRDIVEGEVTIADNLAKRATRNEIVLIKSCICEGLRLAEPVTVRGLHALAHLIAVSKIVNYSEPENREVEGQRYGFVTADALLSYLIGPLGTKEDSHAMFHQLWLTGIVPRTLDAHVAAAMLAAREGDTLHTASFAKTLMLTYVARAAVSMEDREDWDITKQFADKLREKALRGKP